MEVVTSKITLDELKRMAERGFGVMVKAVVDIDRRVMAIDAELHSDQEARMIGEGSLQEHLWGINLYPDMPVDEWVEFDSMINLRPSQGNRSRGVEDPEVRARILGIVGELVER